MYRARTRSGEAVAVKVIRLPATRGPTARAPVTGDIPVELYARLKRHEAKGRASRETRLLGMLGRVEGFVPLLDVGWTPQRDLFLVMPLLSGGTLRDRIANGPLAVTEALALLSKLARAIGRAHTLGIVHRDLKPENILFTAAGEPLVTDLGIAKHYDRAAPDASASVGLSVTGEARGTFGYMPPEQMENAKHVGPPADVFALGAILFECLTGTRAFAGSRLVEIMVAVTSGNRPRVRDLNPHVSEWLEGIVDKALASDPLERFRDGGALADALEARGAPDLHAEAPRRARSWRGIGIGLAALVLVAGSVGGGWILRSTPTAPPTLSLSPLEWSGGVLDVGCIASGDHGPSVRLSLIVDGTASPLGAERTFSPSGHASASFEVPASARRLRVRAETNGNDGRPVAAEQDVIVRERGWSGELMPAGMERSHERGVYVWHTGHALDIAMVYVPAGEFLMGSDNPGDPQDQKPAHRHSVRAGFWIARYETTCREYAAFSRATGHAPPVHYEEPELAAESHPVVGVSWTDAVAFCRWAGLRLPSEAEWEKAARAPDDRLYPWGNSFAPEKTNFCDASCPRDLSYKSQARDGVPYTAPVGSFPSDRAACGAFDMAGNVSEWIDDWYDDGAYRRYATGDFLPPGSGAEKVTRGGGWYKAWWDCGSTFRAKLPPDATAPAVGFRAAR